MKNIKLNKININNDSPFILIAGPCVVESEKHCLYMVQKLKKITQELNIPFVFKVSFDKANRSSIDTYRGPWFKEGLRILKKIKNKINVPILTDVHSIEQIKSVAKMGKIINIKKGQFLAPWDMNNIIEKIEKSGNDKIILTERG